MENKVYIKTTKWSERRWRDNIRELMILWSDKTWDSFEIEEFGHDFNYDPDKMTREEYEKYTDVKKAIWISSAVGRRLCKEDTIEYINNKIKEFNEFKERVSK